LKGTTFLFDFVHCGQYPELKLRLNSAKWSVLNYLQKIVEKIKDNIPAIRGISIQWLLESAVMSSAVLVWECIGDV